MKTDNNQRRKARRARLSPANRSHETYRSVLRRNSCRCIFITNLVFFLTLATLFYLVYLIKLQFKFQLERFERDQRNIHNMDIQSISLNHCRYKSKLINDIRICGYFRPDQDMYVLERRLKRIALWRNAYAMINSSITVSGDRFEDGPTSTTLKANAKPADKHQIQTPPLCFDITYDMDCHESFNKSEVIDVTYRTTISECPGFQHRFNVSSKRERDILAPAVENEILTAHKTKTLLATQLVIKCPFCTPMTTQFRFESQPKDDQCFERLRTVDHGWPANFKYCPPIVRSMRPCEKDKGLAEVPFDMINQTSYPDFVTEEPVTTRSP